MLTALKNSPQLHELEKSRSGGGQVQAQRPTMCEPRIVQAGIEREKSGQAPRHVPAAVSENRERAAEVRHGERQDPHSVGLSQGVSKGSRPLRPAAKYLRLLGNT